MLFRSTILERVTWQKKEHVFFKADGSPYISESDNPIECQKYGDGPISLNTKCKITYQQLIFFYVTISPSSQTTCFAKQGKNIFFMVFSLILISVFYLNCFLFQILWIWHLFGCFWAFTVPLMLVTKFQWKRGQPMQFFWIAKFTICQTWQNMAILVFWAHIWKCQISSQVGYPWEDLAKCRSDALTLCQ